MVAQKAASTGRIDLEWDERPETYVFKLPKLDIRVPATLPLPVLRRFYRAVGFYVDALNWEGADDEGDRLSERAEDALFGAMRGLFGIATPPIVVDPREVMTFREVVDIGNFLQGRLDARKLTLPTGPSSESSNGSAAD